jgi:hypothetical protein
MQTDGAASAVPIEMLSMVGTDHAAELYIVESHEINSVCEVFHGCRHVRVKGALWAKID